MLLDQNALPLFRNSKAFGHTQHSSSTNCVNPSGFLTVLERGFRVNYITRCRAESVSPVTLRCEHAYNWAAFVGGSAVRGSEREVWVLWYALERCLCGPVTLRSRAGLDPRGPYFRMRKTFCTSATTPPVSSLTSTAKMGSIFSCVFNSRRSS